MTTQEAADYLGMTRQRVGVLIRDGRIKARRHGRDWWIEKRDLDAFDQRPRQTGRPRKD